MTRMELHGRRSQRPRRLAPMCSKADACYRISLQVEKRRRRTTIMARAAPQSGGDERRRLAPICTSRDVNYAVFAAARESRIFHRIPDFMGLDDAMVLNRPTPATWLTTPNRRRPPLLPACRY